MGTSRGVILPADYVRAFSKNGLIKIALFEKHELDQLECILNKYNERAGEFLKWISRN